MIHGTAVIGDPPQHRDAPDGIPPQVADTARISAFVVIDAGIKRPTTVGARTFVMHHAVINHDCVVESDVEIAAGAVLGGHCTVKEGARIGMNATLLPGTTVGANAQVGAGAVVCGDVQADSVVAGCPARPL